MTNHGNHHENDALPPELAALASDLDRLAAHDAGSADASLADRIFMKTRSAVLHEGMTPAVRKVNDDMAAMGAHERRSAVAGLEQRVFDATVHHLREPEAPAVIATIGMHRWFSRVAIAAGLAIAAAGVWMVMNNQAGPTTGGNQPIATDTTSGTNPAPVVAVDSDPKDPIKSNTTELEAVLASSEAEDSFVALFAIGDDLRSDIKAVATEAERVEKALGGELSTGG
jgi:hypothetical protein